MPQSLELGDLLGSLYDGNPDGIAVYDRSGRFVIGNAAAHALTGFSADELVGTSFRDHIFHHQHARLAQVVSIVLEGGLGSLRNQPQAQERRDYSGRVLRVPR